MRQLAPLLFSCLLTACGDGEPFMPADATLPDGGRYRGEIVAGRLQGEGRIDYPNGSYYVGTFEDGLWQGQGVWQGANGDRYEGEFHSGLFHGQGRLSYAAGGVYEGQFQRGSLHGEGRYTEPGTSYTGAFKNDLYDGTGRLERHDGSYYEGAFVEGQPHGEGTRVDESGELSGTFVNGQLSGQGVFRGSSGERYRGGFENDLFHGYGHYEDATGASWKGTFSQGELNGVGEYVGTDGTRYTGSFKHGLYHGNGHLIQAGGSHYTGHFSTGRFEGAGTLVHDDGTEQAGIWRGGRLIQDNTGTVLPDPLELGLLDQGRLLAEALDAVPASTSAAELYTLTFAGDGQQSVFLREADYVNRLLAERFAAHGQISLTNHRDHMTDRPLATRENLARSLQTLAERSSPEDLIFIYLTSHGSADHQLAIAQPRLALEDLPASELANLMTPLAERNKVIVISACYSGGFIEPLKSPNTLVMTASRADRVSFGCSEESDFTYFGRALFAEALKETRNLEHAFELAKTRVAEREQADHYQPSEPQIWAPDQVVEHWRLLNEQQQSNKD